MAMAHVMHAAQSCWAGTAPGSFEIVPPHDHASQLNPIVLRLHLMHAAQKPKDLSCRCSTDPPQLQTHGTLALLVRCCWCCKAPRAAVTTHCTKTKLLFLYQMLTADVSSIFSRCQAGAAQSCWAGSTSRAYRMNFQRPTLLSLWPYSGSVTSSGNAMPYP